jgi:CRISP-associated protein Cas1
MLIIFIVQGYPAGVDYMDVPWLVVAGFGAHIKSTRTTLVIQRNGHVEEYALGSIRHLLIIGGHTLQTAVITRLVRQSAAITFFEPDGRLVAGIRPSNGEDQYRLSEIQKNAPGYRYAVSIARASMKSKTLLIGQIGENTGRDLFYEGEREIFSKFLGELDFLIKMSEIRRIHRLTSDMYYEVLSRAIPPEFGFRRRKDRPYDDPVNAVFAFGYAMLFGNVFYAITGSHLDPAIGTLNRGHYALVYDIMEPLKADMIDRQVVRFVNEDLSGDDYECGPDRCILSDCCMRKLIETFHGSISQDIVDDHVLRLRESLENKTDYIIER